MAPVAGSPRCRRDNVDQSNGMDLVISRDDRIFSFSPGMNDGIWSHQGSGTGLNIWVVAMPRICKSVTGYPTFAA